LQYHILPDDLLINLARYGAADQRIAALNQLLARRGYGGLPDVALLCVARHGTADQGALALAELLERYQAPDLPVASLPDVCLLAMILCGSPQQASDALGVYRGWLERELRHRLRNLPNDVEDFTQEALITFHAQVRELDPLACRGWLILLATNLGRDELRRPRNRRRRTLGNGDGHVAASSGPAEDCLDEVLQSS
jgi:hypothetical protein